MTGLFDQSSVLQMGVATGVFIAALAGLFMVDVLFTTAARVFATALAIAVMIIICSFNVITIIFSIVLIIYRIFIEINERSISGSTDLSPYDWYFTEPLDRYRRKSSSKYRIFDGTTLYICKMDEMDDDFRVYMISGVAPSNCKLQLDSCGSYFLVRGDDIEEAKEKLKTLYGIDKIYENGTYDFFINEYISHGI